MAFFRSITNAGRKARTALVVTVMLALLTVGIGLVLATTTPGAEAQSAPGAVTNLTLTRADGTVTANWEAPAGSRELPCGLLTTAYTAVQNRL